MQQIRKTHRTKRIHRRTKVLQTETYQLNLIERSDPFLPDSLNENTQKIENAMIAHEENIEQRLVVLEGHKFAYGTYHGTDYQNRIHISVGFAPKAVLYMNNSPANSGYHLMMSVRDNERPHSYLPLTDDGFDVLTFTSGTYSYIAFG